MRRAFLACGLAAALAACAANDTAPLPTVPTLNDHGASGFTAVSVGRDHTCALDQSGAAYCWGSDQNGQLGYPAPTVCGSEAPTPCSISAEPVSTSITFRQISAGAIHTCGVSVAGLAYCWGGDQDGALGIIVGGGRPASPVRTPQPVDGGISFASISAGYSHTCGISTAGVAYCWGMNDRGQLGTGDTTQRLSPTPVATGARFVGISAGQQRTCGQTTAGTVLCWGNSWLYREDGLEYMQMQLTPQPLAGAPTFEAVSVGTFTTCGLSGEAAYCWEANPYGEMGTGTTAGSRSPLPVVGGLQFVSISAGLVQTCGLTRDQAAYCWGNDSFGQLGVSPASLSARCASQSLLCALAPVRVIGWYKFSSLSTGLGGHACGVTSDGNIYCWGLGASGQLGFGGLVSATSQPVRVSIALP